MDQLKIREVGGRAVPVPGDDIDTDRIFPARYLKEISFARLGDYPFFDERFQPDGTPKAHPFGDARFKGAAILLANANFGCGSSREHAPQALMRWGIKAIVAESYGEIFAGNCAMLGMPAVVANREDAARLQALARQQPGTAFTLDLAAMTVIAGGLSVSVSMPAAHRSTLLQGTWDTTAMLLANAGRARQVAARLDAMSI